MDTFTPSDLSHAVFSLISGAVMCSKETLLEAADRIEKEAKNGYYDDQEGSELMMKIVAHLRLRSEKMPNGFRGV